ncbi:hypothetical protein [Micromonospora sp. NPDC005087]
MTSTASGVAELLDQPVTHVIADGVRVPHGVRSSRCIACGSA